MVLEQSENGQLVESHDAPHPGVTPNWSGNGAGARKKKNHGQKAKLGEMANLPALTPTSEDQQQLMIAKAAYYRAEKRGFTEGYSVDDWLVAEAEIKGMQSS